MGRITLTLPQPSGKLGPAATLRKKEIKRTQAIGADTERKVRAKPGKPRGSQALASIIPPHLQQVSDNPPLFSLWHGTLKHISALADRPAVSPFDQDVDNVVSYDNKHARCMQMVADLTPAQYQVIDKELLDDGIDDKPISVVIAQ